ncbi:hypothetical protein [Campylobacter showae]|uniref:hypothetical protein n=1 Tax=Campylobacter showae TaxID=204 RepID=UPI0028F1275C|nr:hypothetical protein [Campylobacter showae]
MAFGRDGFSKFDAHFLLAKAARQILLMTRKFSARIDFAAKFDRFKFGRKFS